MGSSKAMTLLLVVLCISALGCQTGEAYREQLTAYTEYTSQHEGRWQFAAKEREQGQVVFSVVASSGDVRLDFSRAVITGPEDPVDPHLRFISTAPPEDIRPTFAHEVFLSQLDQVPGESIWYGDAIIRQWKVHLMFEIHEDATYSLRYVVHGPLEELGDEASIPAFSSWSSC